MQKASHNRERKKYECGFKWAMAGIVKREVWAWKSIARREKYFGLIPMAII